MDTIGERIRWLRKQQLKLTLDAFGQRLAVTAASVSAFELGKTNPSDQTIRAICREFGVDELWLRTGTGEPFARKTRSETITEYLGQVAGGKRSETELLLIELMSETSVEEWQALSLFFRRLAEKMEKPGTE